MSQRMLRGMAAGLGALVSLGSMAGCGTDGQVQKATSIKIGVTVYDQYDTFVSQMMTDFNEYAAEQEEQTGIAINVEVYNAAGSQSTQNSQVEEMLDAGCNVICVNLVDRTEPTTIIDMAEKNNVPVIFFNRELVEEDLERWDRVIPEIGLHRLCERCSHLLIIRRHQRVDPFRINVRLQQKHRRLTGEILQLLSGVIRIHLQNNAVGSICDLLFDHIHLFHCGGKAPRRHKAQTDVVIPRCLLKPLSEGSPAVAVAVLDNHGDAVGRLLLTDV